MSSFRPKEQVHKYRLLFESRYKSNGQTQSTSSEPLLLRLCLFRYYGVSFHLTKVGPRLIQTRSKLGHLIPDTFDQNTWWGTQIHGGEPMHGGEPTYMVAWPALVGGQVGRPGWEAREARPLGRPCAPPWRPPPKWPSHHVCGLPTMHGFPIMYLGSPPCTLIKGIR